MLNSARSPNFSKISAVLRDDFWNPSSQDNVSKCIDLSYLEAAIANRKRDKVK
jgi:hypothetical protein